MSETTIMFDIRAAITGTGAWCQRNNTGFDQVRKVHYGIGLGGSDLVCIPTTGRFVGIEVKTVRGRTAFDQECWARGVRNAGGFYSIARSPESALEAIARASLCRCPRCGESIIPAWEHNQ